MTDDLKPAKVDRSLTAAHERIEQLEADYHRACQTIAEMHAAAMGAVVGPNRGVVEDIADLRAECDELKADATRLDYIEQLAESSRSGVTIDYAKYVEDGRVLERGYRISWFHHLGDREKTLRKAIDTAIAKGEERRVADGYDCTCAAHSENECCCGADWTPQETYDLRNQLAASQQREQELMAKVGRLKQVPMKYRRMTFNAELQEENARLQAREAELLAGLKADAMRYRAIKQWHKAYRLGGIPGGGNIHLLTSTRWPEQLDAAIDAAIANGEKT